VCASDLGSLRIFSCQVAWRRVRRMSSKETVVFRWYQRRCRVDCRATGYDPFGRPTSVADPVKTTTTTYKDAARYKRTTTAGTGLTLDEVEHYDELGRVVLTRSSETGSLGSIGSVSESARSAVACR
jgi:YD repeat-containing protein